MGSPRRFFITSLGCPKNLVDSERLAAGLARAGWRRTTNPMKAQLVVVNTCAFVSDAQRESVRALLAACALKDGGAVARVVAVGCLVQREAEALATSLPQLDLLLGVNDWQNLPQLLDHSSGERVHVRLPGPILRGPRRSLGPAHVRYLKIAEGCDCGCGFCVIPSIRGRQRSSPPEELVREARMLLARGAKELILVAQDTTAYGLDMGLRDGLSSLLQHLSSLPQAQDRWIRVLYLNPARVDQRLLQAMLRPPVLPYFDLALQHVSPRVLAAMRRPAPPDGWRTLVETIRTQAPDATIRATFLIGHPGETADDFRQLLRFLEWARIERVGVFVYDPQPGTPSASMERPSPGTVRRRLHELEELLSEQAAEQLDAMVGKDLLMVVDRCERGVAVCRPWTDAPDVDWTYTVRARLRPGTRVTARVRGGRAGTVEAELIQLG